MGELIGDACITPIFCMILGLPIALYLHYKRGFRWDRAIGNGGLIVFGLVVFIGIVLSLGGVIDTGVLPQIANNNLRQNNIVSPTHTASPIHTLQSIVTPTTIPPLVATFASGLVGASTEPVDWENKFKEVHCESELPERFTSMRCFNLSVVVPHSLIILPAWGTVYYSGNNITHLQISYKERGKEYTSVECAKFVIDVARSAGWNLDDLSNILSRVSNAQEREWVKYNTIAAYRDSNPDWWFFDFEQVP